MRFPHRFLLSFFFAPLLFLLNLAPSLQAAPEQLDWLTVDIWPEFDRPGALVLLTGSLPIGAPLPAQITIPLPEEATLNAVARISEANEMVDDISFNRNGDTLTLLTPDRRFRVEYYAPTVESEIGRQYRFVWEAPLAVDELSLSVQRPAAATAIDIDPAPEAVVQGLYGLEYAVLPTVSVYSGQPYLAELRYVMGSAQLTASLVEGEASMPGAAPDAAVVAEPFDLQWGMALAAAGGALLALALGWQLWGSRLRARQRPLKPRPRRGADSGGSANGDKGATGVVRFCHHCGARAKAGGRFCQQCGRRLKESA
ncbi:MAG: zinc ribbon domain-containing protein [Candidatus Promineifilaceae bacterium]|nr:zinc ribbon domain-containing protein [Candidatus Promineifilaceae bacterium]